MFREAAGSLSTHSHTQRFTVAEHHFFDGKNSAYVPYLGCAPRTFVTCSEFTNTIESAMDHQNIVGLNTNLVVYSELG